MIFKGESLGQKKGAHDQRTRFQKVRYCTGTGNGKVGRWKYNRIKSDLYRNMLEPHVDPVVAQLPTDAVAEAVPPVGVAVGEPTTLSHGTVIQGYTAYKFCRIYN